MEKDTVEPVDSYLGFYSRLFVVPKPGKGNWRPIIDLLRLNEFMTDLKCKFETPKSVLQSIVRGGLDGISGPEGCLLPDPSPPGIPEVPAVHLARPSLPVLAPQIFTRVFSIVAGDTPRGYGCYVTWTTA